MIKKIILSAVLSAAVLIISGCDDAFAPKTPFVPEYIVYGIIKGDSLTQSLLLAKTYDVNGTNPGFNTESPEIAGATVKIRRKNTTVTMRDTLLERTDTSRYKAPIKAYYSLGFVPSHGDTLHLEITTPDGKTLNSRTIVPPSLYLEKSFYNIGGDRDDNLAGSFTLTWRIQSGFLFLPRMQIIYMKDGDPEQKTVEVPYYYTRINNKDEAVYPFLSSNPYAQFRYDAIDSALVSISRGDPAKNTYRILRANFRVITLDEHFAKYYSSTNGYLDALSVRLDEVVYSNITGGRGVFGSYMITQETFVFNQEYVESFGYRAR